MMERRFISYETNALSGRALCTLANLRSWAAMGCPAARALGLVPVLIRFVLPRRGGLKPSDRRLPGPVDFTFRVLIDCKTENAPEWFRGVGFALAVVVDAYGLR